MSDPTYKTPFSQLCRAGCCAAAWRAVFIGCSLMFTSMIAPLTGWSQRPESEVETPKPEVGLVLAEREHVIELSRARTMLENEQRFEALQVLQRIIDREGDFGYPVQGTNRQFLRNLQVEAEAMLGDLPAGVFGMYEQAFGDESRRLLSQGTDTGDLDVLAKASRRFLHTRAGCEATYLLGLVHLDQDRPLEAAVWLQRVSQSRAAASIDQDALALRSAMAWCMADLPEAARPKLAELIHSAPRRTFDLPGQRPRRFDNGDQALAWLNGLVGKATLAAPIVNTTSASTLDEILSSSEDLDPVWSVPTTTWETPADDTPFATGKIDVRRQVKRLAQDRVAKDRAAVPTGTTLILGNKVFFRSLTSVQAWDISTGKLDWKSHPEEIFERVRNGSVQPLPGDRGSILDPMLEDRVYNNATYSGMSTNGEFLFCLEELGFAQQSTNTNAFQMSYRRPTPRHPLNNQSYNSLSAYAVDGGKLRWRVGGPATDPGPLSGCFFLGTPLAKADQLFCLAERGQRIELLALDASDGDLEWRQELDEVSVDVTRDVDRGRAGMTPVYWNGMFICPTGTGMIVAVDLATRKLAWSYRYRDRMDADPNRARIIMAQRAALARRGVIELPAGPADAAACYTQVLGNRLVFAPRDSESVYCFDLNSRSLSWLRPRKDVAFCGGAFNDQLVMVGHQTVDLWDMDDGESTWKEPVPIATPSGRGLLHSGVFFLPLSTGMVAKIDLQAKTVDDLLLQPGQLLGNLSIADQTLLLLAGDELRCFRRNDGG